MRVIVKLFAIVREQAGVASLSLELPEGGTIAIAEGHLLEQYPALGPHLPRCAFALNRALAARDGILRDGDELAVLPPVSGGNGT